MKKFNFWTCACLVCISSMVMAQNDLNWLIVNQNGRNSNGAYNNSISTNNFYINGIPHPNLQSFPQAENELFVIYSDGHYFSSRGGVNIFSSPVPNQVIHFMNGRYLNSTIHHAYLTRTYQGNDPPPSYTVTGNAIGTSHDGPFKFDRTTPTQALTANQDVVRNSDITLIISHQLLLDSLNEGAKRTFLRFKSILPVNGGAPVTSPDFFITRSFGPSGNSAFYPESNATLIGTQPGELELLNVFTSNFTYVNLRPHLIPDAFFLQNPQNPQLATHQALFEIVDENGTVVTTLREDLRNSHDPNFMKVLGVQQDDTDCVCYQIHFENHGSEPATELKVEILFGPNFRTYCVGEVTWRAGSYTNDGEVDIHRANQYRNLYERIDMFGIGRYLERRIYQQPRRVTFNFHDNSKLLPIRDASNPQQVREGSADLKFCMKINPEIEWALHENSLKPLVLRIYFGEDAYQIMEFQDIYKYEPHPSGPRHAGTSTCDWDCPRQ